MTFAEIFIFVVAAFGLYILLRPLHHRLEKFFYKYFRTKSRGKATIIDINGPNKKDRK
jgi:predicted PurR-regulated permease PerM